MERKKNDLRVTHVKGSGPGGQHRNKRQTGIRIEHVPTGTVVTATERRSQTQNLRNAEERLEERLEKMNRRQKRRLATKSTAGGHRRRLKQKNRRKDIKSGRRKATSDD